MRTPCDRAVPYTAELDCKEYAAMHPARKIFLGKVSQERGDCPRLFSSRKFPFEFNLANGNFASLWRSLGLTLREDVWGHIDGRTLLGVLEVPVEKLLSQDSQYDGDQGGTVIDFGISRSQAERYLQLLRSLADEASRREEPVVLG